MYNGNTFSFDYNCIYVYDINDDAHNGYLKVGKASFSSKYSMNQLTPNHHLMNVASHQRIKAETKTALIDYNLLYTELACRQIFMDDGSSQTQNFMDKDIHKILENAGYVPKLFIDSGRKSEWYPCDLDTIKKAIKAFKEGRTSIDSQEKDPAEEPKEQFIKLRDEQKDNVEKTYSVLSGEEKRFLWDCKMRYGKTITAYEFLKKAKYQKVIVITHRPAVKDGWGKDHDLIFNPNEHLFVDRTVGGDRVDDVLDMQNDNELTNVINSGKPFIYFTSIHDLVGSKIVGGKYNKNKVVFKTDWDLVIVDEAHEGIHTERGEKVMDILVKDKTKILELSGTPYNIYSEYGEHNSFKWTYIDEQRAKREWENEHPSEPNPYAGLPTMNILTFDLADALDHSYRYVKENAAFSFGEFFRVWTGNVDKDFRKMPPTAKVGDFVHEDDVKAFLDLITTDSEETNYPFATEEKRENFAHTFWVVPGVKEAAALSKLLDQHPVFGAIDENGNKIYGIANVAGDGDEEKPYDDALNLVRSCINTYEKTITLSCGKLTTGVTVPEWTAAMMLSGSTTASAQGYMQAIFRVQSPCKKDGQIKTNCYVFDFAPDRAIKVVADVHHIQSTAGIGGDEKVEIKVGEFLNYCPVISVEGTKMVTYDVVQMIQQIKRISIDHAVNSGFDDNSVYLSDAGITIDDEIDPEVVKKLGDVLAPTKKSRKTTVDLGKNNLTPEERKKLADARRKPKKERTPEEQALFEKLKEQKKEQQKLFNLLRTVSIRLPLLFYGADEDISKHITLEDFIEIVDDESWKEFMPAGLTKDFFLKILRYYDKNVVMGAGMRIRKMAKAADELMPTYRTRQIVEIISKFKNPDKETVLTPWRVVNMHMGDTIGGYNFFNEDYSEEITDLDEPRFIEHDGITDTIFLNDKVKILEMNSKSGLYPLYVAYTIYMLKVDGKEKDFPYEKAMELWKETLEENIYVLCKTTMAQSITKRTLAGFTDINVNTLYLTKLIERMRTDVKRISNKITNPQNWSKEGERLKFDAVVGNPPYQETTNGGVSNGKSASQAKPLFHLFVQTAKQLNPTIVSMIIPARWYNGGIGLDGFRDNMINDNKLVKLFDFYNSKECFTTVDIAGGLCYFLWDSDYSGDCNVTNVTNNHRVSLSRPLNQFGDLFIRSNISIPIINKVRSKSTHFLDEMVSSMDTFGLPTNEHGHETYKEGDLVLIHSATFNSQGQSFIERDRIKKNIDLIDKYKVKISRMIPQGGEVGIKPENGYRSISTPQILAKNEVDTFSYLNVGFFDTEEEAINYKDYLTCKFTRFMLRTTYSGVNVSQGNFVFVPMMDFTKHWNDEQLYLYFDLNDSEIELIESTMRDMSDC